MDLNDLVAAQQRQAEEQRLRAEAQERDGAVAEEQGQQLVLSVGRQAAELLLNKKGPPRADRVRGPRQVQWWP